MPTDSDIRIILFVVGAVALAFFALDAEGDVYRAIAMYQGL